MMIICLLTTVHICSGNFAASLNKVAPLLERVNAIKHLSEFFDMTEADMNYPDINELLRADMFRFSPHSAEELDEHGEINMDEFFWS